MGDILGYVRAATSDQDLTGQTTRLNRAGAVKVFCDCGCDQAMPRTGLESLLAEASTGDTIAVAGLDRLGRTITELLTTIGTLKARGIGLVCLDEAIDTRSTDGALILHLFTTIARCERQLSVERSTVRCDASAAPGKRRGRPPLAGDKVAAALGLVASGLSPAAAARQLRLGRSTIYREVSRAGIARIASSRGA